MYEAFKRDVLSATIFGDLEPRTFLRMALRPCDHGAGRKLWDRVRGRPHPATHHVVIETYHAEKLWAVTLYNHAPQPIATVSDITEDDNGVTVTVHDPITVHDPNGIFEVLDE